MEYIVDLFLAIKNEKTLDRRPKGAIGEGHALYVQNRVISIDGYWGYGNKELHDLENNGFIARSDSDHPYYLTDKGKAFIVTHKMLASA